jgi:hypothetical protein
VPFPPSCKTKTNMSVNLDFKLRNQETKFPRHNLFWPNIKQVDLRQKTMDICNNDIITKGGSNSIDDDDAILYWNYAARVACFVALMPMIIYTKNETLTKSAACTHLLLTPVTSFCFLTFSYVRCSQKRMKIISCALCGLCLTLGNCSAVILIMSSSSNVWCSYLLSGALCIGSIQLLIVLDKGNVIRVMGCTAAAVMVIVLAILGSSAAQSPNTTKRFFQSSALPFLLLFLETSRCTSSTQTSPV